MMAPDLPAEHVCCCARPHKMLFRLKVRCSLSLSVCLVLSKGSFPKSKSRAKHPTVTCCLWPHTPLPCSFIPFRYQENECQQLVPNGVFHFKYNCPSAAYFLQLLHGQSRHRAAPTPQVWLAQTPEPCINNRALCRAGAWLPEVSF